MKTDDLNQKLIDEIRKNSPEQLAKDLVSVQPMPDNIDFDAIAKSPLWQSWVNRHWK